MQHQKTKWIDFFFSLLKAIWFSLGRNSREGMFKRHIVDFLEGSGTHSRLLPNSDNIEPNKPNLYIGMDLDEAIADV